MRTKAAVLAVLLVIGLASPGGAEEGMWLLDEIRNLPEARMKAMGLQLAPEKIISLKDAIVQVGGGTGSFVSPDGLILTNHHVAYGAIQYESTAEQNFIANGYLAETRDKELPCTGYNAYITSSWEDVTGKILSAVKPEMSYGDRYDAIERKKEELVKAAEAAGKVESRVVEMLSGTKYYLFNMERIKDIRLVYAPPASIGEYGGDIDNWMWPRHTGDFSFLRAYVAPDGSSAEYSKANVPYRPRAHLVLSTSGFRDGSFIMVLGYPGNTFRYRSSYSIDLWQNDTFPLQIKMAQAQLDVLEKASENEPELKVRFADRVKGINNGLKNNQGMVEGLRKSNLLERKRQQEAEFKAFLARNGELGREYGDVLPKIAEIYSELRTYQLKQSIMGYLGASQIYGMADTIYDWVTELAKPEGKREPGYDPKRLPDIRRALQNAQRNLHVPTDKRMLAMVLHEVAALPQGQRVEALESVLKGRTGKELDHEIQSLVEDLYGKTRLADENERLKMIDMSPAELEKLGDSFIKFVAALKKENDEIKEKYDRFVGAVFELRPRLIRGYYEWKKSGLYSDANSTLRFTYGQVKGYKPRDAVSYDWITHLSGVIEKDTGEEPFDCPEELVRLYREADFGRYIPKGARDVPVNFLADTDITGGNSGSPVLNGKGELIGVVFDGNYESMSSDFQYDPALTRTISADARYVLFVTEKFGKAQNLLKELTIR